MSCPSLTSPGNIVSCLLVNIILFIASARIQVLKTHIKLVYSLIKDHLGSILDTLEYITSPKVIACDQY